MIGSVRGTTTYNIPDTCAPDAYQVRECPSPSHTHTSVIYMYTVMYMYIFSLGFFLASAVMYIKYQVPRVRSYTGTLSF